MGLGGGSMGVGAWGVRVGGGAGWWEHGGGDGGLGCCDTLNLWKHINTCTCPTCTDCATMIVCRYFLLQYLSRLNGHSCCTGNKASSQEVKSNTRCTQDVHTKGEVVETPSAISCTMLSNT